MGNATSCAPLASTGPVKILTLDGTLEEYIRPINAGDLMLENPRQFVCDSIDLKVGHLVPGLTADEELEPRQFYFLLPIHMLYSVLTHEEMFSLTHKASKALKQSQRSKNIGRIFPVLGDFFIFNSQIKPLKGSAGEPNTILRVSRQGSWRPALDTIIESPSTLR